MSVVEAVTDPDSFFRRELPDGDIRIAAVILFVFAAVVAGVVFGVGQSVAGAADLTESERATLQSALLAASVIVGVTSGAGAVILAGLYYLGTAVVDGSGSLRDTIVVAAWAQLPGVVGTLLSGAVFFLTFDPPPGLSDPQAVATRAQSFRSTPITLTIDAVVAFWQVYIVGYGLTYARGVTLKQGLTVAVLVTGLLFAVQSL